MRSIASLTLAVLGFSEAAFADDFDRLIGDWVVVTPGNTMGETVAFKKVFGGYDAVFSWWGQTAMTFSNGEAGSHVKISGTQNGDSLSCFYNVSMLNAADMVWARKSGVSEKCPGSVEFKRPEGLEQDSAPKTLVISNKCESAPSLWVFLEYQYEPQKNWRGAFVVRLDKPVVIENAVGSYAYIYAGGVKTADSNYINIDWKGDHFIQYDGKSYGTFKWTFKTEDGQVHMNFSCG